MNEQNSAKVAENNNPQFKAYDFSNAEMVADYLLANVPDQYRECGYTSKNKRFYMFVNKSFLNGGEGAPKVFEHNLVAYMATKSKRPVTEEMCRDKKNTEVHLCVWKNPDETQGYHGYIGMLCRSKYERF